MEVNLSKYGGEYGGNYGGNRCAAPPAAVFWANSPCLMTLVGWWSSPQRAETHTRDEALTQGRVTDSELDVDNGVRNIALDADYQCGQRVT